VDLSVIVPLFNEEQNVEPLYEALVRELSPLKLDYEILLVDDGGTDATFQRAKRLAESDKRVRVLKFRRNYGQTAAMAAGIDHARGTILLTMDGDLQNDPADIADFIEKIKEGYDIVVGWRYNRQDKLVTRRIPSVIANWIIGKVTGVPIKDNGCSLKAYRAEIVKNIPLYSEMHRFIPAMMSLAGARIAEIKVRHHARKYGVSKYGLSRIYKVLLDLLTIKTLVSFASRPLLWFGILAAPAALTSAVTLAMSFHRLTIQATAFSVPLAGVGLLFAALACFLVLGGTLAELIYRTGNMRTAKLEFLTAQTLALENSRATRD
jgi:glycosyltransferase involved in cell wall biosynthesis